MNIDNIKFDDILNSMNEQTKCFNKKSIDAQIRENHSIILDKYELLCPSEVASVLCAGDCIRYTNNTEKISSCVIVKLIKYLDDEQKYIDYICVCSTNNIKLRKLYLTNYYVFKLNKSSMGHALRERLNKYINNNS